MCSHCGRGRRWEGGKCTETSGKGEAGEGWKNHTNQLGLSLQARWSEGKLLSGTAGGTGRLLARDIEERKRQAAHGSCSRPLTVHLGHIRYTEPHGLTPIFPTHWLTDPEQAPETTAPQAPCEEQRTQGNCAQRRSET